MTAMVADRQADATAGTRQPALYIPHGGGPCFFMDDPHGTWTAMAGFLRDIPSTLPGKPKAILLISGHWETRGFTFTSSEKPPLIYDYYGFPPHTYEIRYDAPGDPALAARAVSANRRSTISTAIGRRPNTRRRRASSRALSSVRRPWCATVSPLWWRKRRPTN